MKKIALAVAVAAAAFSGVVSAQSSDNWVNSNGTVWRNSAGLCWQDDFWTPATANFQCLSKKPVPKDIVLNAETFFAFDVSRLNKEGIAILTELASQLKQLASYNKQLKSITVTGYTDSIGTVKYNIGLSKRRAASVANFLIAHGVPAGIITQIGKGESDPVASNATAAGRAQNRRVVVHIMADAIPAK